MRPTKRRKVEESTDGLKKIVKLEEELTKAIKDGDSLNALADLLAEAKRSTDQPQKLHKAIYSLYRIFSLLIANEWFHPSTHPDEGALVVRKWLLQRLDQYLDFLPTVFEHSEPLISVSKDDSY
jgi:U3 small nucleolar RNA-associated protein 19